MKPLIAIANSAASDANSGVSGVTSEIAKLREQWARELHDKQLDQMIAHYAPDAAFLSPSEGRFTGQTAIRALFKTVMDTVTSDLNLHSISTESSGDLAYDSGDYSETLVPMKGGPNQHFQGDYLIVFRRQKDSNGSLSNKSGPLLETKLFLQQSSTSLGSGVPHPRFVRGVFPDGSRVIST